MIYVNFVVNGFEACVDEFATVEFVFFSSQFSTNDITDCISRVVSDFVVEIFFPCLEHSVDIFLLGAGISDDEDITGFFFIQIDIEWNFLYSWCFATICTES